MKTIENIREFLDAFVAWASDQPDVQGIALVGSYARGAAKDDSDIALVILTEQPSKYLTDIKWTERFGVIEKHQTEDYVEIDIASCLVPKWRGSGSGIWHHCD